MRKYSNEEFINKCEILYPNKFTYEKTNYINAKSRVTVTCKIHGDFTVFAGFLINKGDCPKCGYIANRIKRKNIFIKLSQKLHNNKYDYSLIDYIHYNKKIKIICPEHGEFMQTPAAHLYLKQRCPKCSIKIVASLNTSTKEHFVNKARKIHGDRYNYDKCVYIKSSEKVKIICKIHGEFLQVASCHLSGSGCEECSHAVNIYKQSDWLKLGNNREGTFYVLECWNENERFYKFGITINSVKRRYSGKKEMPYNYKIIKEIKSKDLKYIWNLEQETKKNNLVNRYIPKIPFGGSSTECYI